MWSYLLICSISPAGCDVKESGNSARDLHHKLSMNDFTQNHFQTLLLLANISHLIKMLTCQASCIFGDNLRPQWVLKWWICFKSLMLSIAVLFKSCLINLLVIIQVKLKPGKRVENRNCNNSSHKESNFDGRAGIINEMKLLHVKLETTNNLCVRSSHQRRILDYFSFKPNSNIDDCCLSDRIQPPFQTQTSVFITSIWKSYMMGFKSSENSTTSLSI